ncbi:MAG: ATP-binding protein [Gammaproteobacteria bacterium]|nr:ATP-binding protein [Gammaproteobacteria bacterium]MYC26296.1 ATP-binding protein [Gammaproteobacteria bacterium]
MHRQCIEQINVAVKRQAAVVLLGARQVGKTTLALHFAHSCDHYYLDLENPEDRQSLEHPLFFLRQFEHKLVVIDEIHREPELFSVLRVLIDEGRRKGIRTGRFLILGSASVDLLKQSSETLAGRIEFVNLNPLSVAEVGENQTNKLWLSGGFPLSFLADNEEDSHVWRKNFVRTYVERDVLQFNPRVPTELLTRLWTMLAHNQGTMLNSSRLATSLEVTSPTVSKHVGFLTDMLVVRKLNPFQANLGKRLVKTPKVYIRDSGLLHSLLNLRSIDELLRHPVCGFSWEGFVIEQICGVIEGRATPLFYRTADEAEIDLVLEWHRTGDLWAIEIKRSMSRPPSRGFYSSIDLLNARRRFVVCMHQRAFTMQKNVEVLGLSEFLKIATTE